MHELFGAIAECFLGEESNEVTEMLYVQKHFSKFLSSFEVFRNVVTDQLVLEVCRELRDNGKSIEIDFVEKIGDDREPVFAIVYQSILGMRLMELASILKRTKADVIILNSCRFACLRLNSDRLQLVIQNNNHFKGVLYMNDESVNCLELSSSKLHIVNNLDGVAAKCTLFKSTLYARLEYLTHVPRHLVVVEKNSPGTEVQWKSSFKNKKILRVESDDRKDDRCVEVDITENSSSSTQQQMDDAINEILGTGNNALITAKKTVESSVLEDYMFRMFVTCRFPQNVLVHGGYIYSLKEKENVVVSSIKEGVDQLLKDHSFYTVLKECAIETAKAMNLCLSPLDQLCFFAIDIQLCERKHHHNNKIGIVFKVLPFPENFHKAVPLEEEDEDFAALTRIWEDHIVIEHIPQFIEDIVMNDLDEDHISLLAMCNDDQFPCVAWNVVKVMSKLCEKTQERINNSHDDEDKLNLKQQRAIMIIGDMLFEMQKRTKPEVFLKYSEEAKSIVKHLTKIPKTYEELILRCDGELSHHHHHHQHQHQYHQFDEHSQRMIFLNPFLSAANEKELQDFNECMNRLSSITSSSTTTTPLHFIGSMNTCHVSQSGMRLGISSANASDNWTSAKLRGGYVLNLAIDLNGQPPVKVQVCAVSNVVIKLQTQLAQGFPLVTREYNENDNDLESFLDVSDPKDAFRFLKYALVFTGIIRMTDDNKLEYQSFPQRIFQDLQQFMGNDNYGLSISIENHGPARSGFASSSAVTVNLLHALYQASGQHHKHQNHLSLFSDALLFENQLGLKSGRQDVDGLLPGLKALEYPKTASVLLPRYPISTISPQDDRMWNHLVLVNSGIQRTTVIDWRRGLNCRHLALLLRDPNTFLPLAKSYGLHEEIEVACRKGDAEKMGKLALKYMGLREMIDAGATESIYDGRAGKRVLLMLFHPFVKEGLIYGGCFSGAMGGGVAMLWVTSQGLKNDSLIARLLELRDFTLSDGCMPFKDLTIINASPNHQGLSYSLEMK